MTVVHHYDSAWILHNVVHNDRHDAALLLCIEGLLGEFAIVPFAQNNLFSFVGIGNIFVDAIL